MVMSICVAMPKGQYRDQIIYQLEHRGDHVITADRGIDLLNHIRYRYFNHIILHTDLPDYDAIELVLYIRDVHPKTSITVVSENPGTLKHQILMAGANHWLNTHDHLNALLHILSSSDSQMMIQ